MQPDVLPGVQTRHCAHCGESFTTRHQAHFYCSVRCRRDAGPKSPALASGLSVLADVDVPMRERIDRLDQPQLHALVQETGRILGRQA